MMIDNYNYNDDNCERLPLPFTINKHLKSHFTPGTMGHK